MMRTSIEIVVALLTSLLASGFAIAGLIAAAALLAASAVLLLVRRHNGADGP